jgi:hypothetical protein
VTSERGARNITEQPYKISIFNFDNWNLFKFIQSVQFKTEPHNNHVLRYKQAVPLLRRLVAGLSPRRPGFTPVSVHVGFVVDKVALGQVSSDFFGFSLSLSFHRVSPYFLRSCNAFPTPLVTLESRSPWLLGSWCHQLRRSSAGANTVYHGVSFSNIISCRNRLLLFVKHLALCVVRGP